MNWNYENYLSDKLTKIQQDLSLSNFKIVVETEQMFAKQKTFSENTIYVVIKYLSGDIELKGVVKTQPIQLMILSEQDSLKTVELIFKKFAQTYNTVNLTEGSTYVKQTYVEPVVLSNFNSISNGYRSILYMSGMLFLMDNILDVKELMIDNVPIEPLNFNMGYTMSGNTQQLATSYLSTTVKSVATFSLQMTIPLLSNYGGNFMDKIIGIMNGTVNGNESFIFDFYIGTVHFEDKNLKLISSQIATSPNQAPSLMLGFTL